MAFGCPICRAVFRAEFARCPRDGAALGQIESDPLVGETIGDRYFIEDLIGEGAMGRVYRARHTRVSRQFAVKVLFGDHAADPKMRARFSREAEAASRVAHANVASVVDFGETPAGLLYLVMDFVDGNSLSREVADVGALGDERSARLARQLAAGLAHAHAQGLVHRDFKGENVILTQGVEGEVPKIVDFGIAVVADRDEHKNRLTTQGMVVGTPAYMAPEQATGEGVDERSDLFSLGVLMYEMLAGVLPFSGSPMAVARQNLAADPPPIAVRVPGLVVAPGLEAIAFRLMEKIPEDRYQNALEVLDALDDVIERSAFAEAGVAAGEFFPGDTAETPEVDRTEDIWALDGHSGPPRRRRMIWAVAAVGVVAIGGLALAQSLGEGPGDDAANASLAATRVVPEAAPADPVVAEPPAAVLAAVKPALTEDGSPDDAATAPEPPAKADPAPKKRPHHRSHRHHSAPKAAPDPAALTRRYVTVGRAIDKLASRKADAAAARLRREYFAIPYQDALRDPALRKEAIAKLRRLGRKIDRLLDGP